MSQKVKMNSQNQLIENCISGDQKAQMAFYDKYYRFVYNTCKRIVNDTHLAEDMMQESFIKAFQSLKKFNTSEAVLPWLKKIAVHHCVDHLRKRKIDLFLDEDIEDIEWEESESFEELRVDDVIQAMNKLAGGYKMILSLYLIEGYDHEEISEILGIQASSSRSQYLRAKRKLQGIIKEKSYV